MKKIVEVLRFGVPVLVGIMIAITFRGIIHTAVFTRFRDIENVIAAIENERPVREIIRLPELETIIQRRPPASSPSSSSPFPPPTSVEIRPIIRTLLRHELRITMSVDRDRAHPNDTLTYTVTVQNTGKRSAYEITILSHLPKHTALHCDQPAKVDSDNEPEIAVCVLPSESPDPKAHTLRATKTILRPDSTWTFVFRVDVVPSTRPGTVITNHAHVGGLTTPETRTTVNNEKARPKD